MTLKEEIVNMSVDGTKTVYVYEENSGRIQYTIEDVHPAQIQNFNKKGIEFYLGEKGHRIAGTFVKKDDAGNPIGVSPIQHMTFININKHTIVADGVDEAVITGLIKGMHVNINNEHSYIVKDEDDKTLELSCDKYSYLPQHNHMTVYFKAYGYHDSQIKINVIEG